MKKIIFASAFLLSGVAGMAQTKMIAHRSHSGSDKNFSAGGSGNLGEFLPEKQEKQKVENKTSAKVNTKASVPKKQTLAKPKVVRKTSTTKKAEK